MVICGGRGRGLEEIPIPLSEPLATKLNSISSN
jgi:hypothetical protein